MVLDLAFWIAYFVALLFVLWNMRVLESRRYWTDWLIFFVLVGMLGWRVFGPMIR